MKKLVTRRYRHMEGIQLRNKKDYPKKCERCGAGQKDMRRHGYVGTVDQEFKYKRFLCTKCGKVMKRLTGRAPTTPV